MLKYKSDVKSVFYMLLIMLCFIALWNYGVKLWHESRTVSITIYVIYLYLSIAVSVIIHNHTHLQMWQNKLLNKITDCWLTIFYGFPVFVWFPTHHKNHHVYVNKRNDVTRTYMSSEKNHLLTLLTYPTLSGGAQQLPIFSFVKTAYSKDPGKFRYYILQIIILITWILSFLILDWQKALILVVIPQQVSLNTVLIFNYLQHVHADEESTYNSSRNFTNTVSNFMLFNNGFHTIHHLRPALHWSTLPAEHDKIKHLILDELNQNTILGFIIKTYLIGLFHSGSRTKSLRLARIKAAKAINT